MTTLLDLLTLRGHITALNKLYQKRITYSSQQLLRLQNTIDESKKQIDELNAGISKTRDREMKNQYEANLSYYDKKMRASIKEYKEVQLPKEKESWIRQEFDIINKIGKPYRLNIDFGSNTANLLRQVNSQIATVIGTRKAVNDTKIMTILKDIIALPDPHLNRDKYNLLIKEAAKYIPDLSQLVLTKDTSDEQIYVDLGDINILLHSMMYPDLMTTSNETKERSPRQKVMAEINASKNDRLAGLIIGTALGARILDKKYDTVELALAFLRKPYDKKIYHKWFEQTTSYPTNLTNLLTTPGTYTPVDTDEEMARIIGFVNYDEEIVRKDVALTNKENLDPCLKYHTILKKLLKGEENIDVDTSENGRCNQILREVILALDNINTPFDKTIKSLATKDFFAYDSRRGAIVGAALGAALGYKKLASEYNIDIQAVMYDLRERSKDYSLLYIADILG